METPSNLYIQVIEQQVAIIAKNQKAILEGHGNIDILAQSIQQLGFLYNMQPKDYSKWAISSCSEPSTTSNTL